MVSTSFIEFPFEVTRQRIARDPTSLLHIRNYSHAGWYPFAQKTTLFKKGKGPHRPLRDVIIHSSPGLESSVLRSKTGAIPTASQASRKSNDP